MFRVLLALGGVVLALLPDRVLKTYTNHAIAAPDEPTPRSWVKPYIRIEGIGAVLVAAVGGRLYRVSLWLCALVGAVAAAFPRRYLDAGGRLAFNEGPDIEWTPGMGRFVRAIGVLAVLIGLAGRRDAASAD